MHVANFIYKLIKGQKKNCSIFRSTYLGNTKICVGDKFLNKEITSKIPIEQCVK